MSKALIAPQPNNDDQNSSDPFSFDAFDQSDDALDGSGSTLPQAPIVAASDLWQPPAAASAAFAPITLGYGFGGASSAAASGTSPATSQIVSTSGSGLVFDNTYASGDSAAYIACAVAAEKQLESLFTNSITINETFNTTYNTSGTFALENSPDDYLNYSYATLKSKLPTSIDTNLPTTDPSGGKGFDIPEAYARMLGLSSATPTVDDTVSLNTYYSWDYGQDVINGITHEITEGGMGRIGGLGDENGFWGTMDLFRYNSSGQHDYTDGRDGDTTYFSSNGIDLSSKGVPSLSFNNEYNSSDVKVNGGDTADWTQNNVFGSTGKGETFTLVQTELDVMEALGWTPALPEDIATTSANWQTPTDWSTGSMPITPEDAFIGVLNAVTTTTDNTVTVNSIGTNTESTLLVGDDSTFTATDGTALSSDITFTWGSGNLGDIGVEIGSTFVIGDTFYNSGSLLVGDGSSGDAFLDLSNTVTLDGGGKLYLGKGAGSEGVIQSAPGDSGGLVNVNNTIRGSGSIFLASFDNEGSGAVDSTALLQVGASSFSNQGVMTAESQSTLDLGEDGATQTLASTGTIILDSSSDLAISGKFTLSGAGAVGLKGAGAEITSDGNGATTFTNESEIGAFYSSDIGDKGVDSFNDLTFDNAGTVLVSGAGNTLTLNTGSLAIGDSGATLEAEDDAILAIDSTVDTGVYYDFEHPFPGGTVEATSGGIIELAASIVDGITGPILSRNGQVVLDDGTFDMLAGSSDTATVEFNGAGNLLEIAKASTEVGVLSGFAVGDLIELKGFDAGATETVVDDVLTITDGALTQTFDLEGATYTTGEFGVIQVSTGYDTLSLQTSFTGGGFTLDLAGGSASLVTLSGTAGDWDLVDGADGTVDLTAAQATVVGPGDTIVFAGGTGNAVSLYDTGGDFDLVSGSNGTIYLNSAQAVVSGGADVIDFNSGTGNAATLFSTAGKWDSVNGSNGTIYLNSAQAVVTGGADTIDFLGGTGNAVTVSGSAGQFDMVNGSNGTVYLTSGQAVVTGEADTIGFVSGSGNAVTVAGTAGVFDMVNGSNGTVYLTTGQAVVTGESNTVDFVSGSGDAATIAGTAGHFDAVNDVGSSGTVYLTGGQAVVTGGSNTIDFVSGSGDAATVAGTAGDADQVNNDGASGTVYLTSGQATVTGASDTIDMMGTSTMTQSGASDAFVFQAAIGLEKISGFASTDSMQFTASDFANFAAMLSDTFQSGSATVIKLDASDKVTLTNTLDTSLIASQFHFV